jgi:hypothetical protein
MVPRRPMAGKAPTAGGGQAAPKYPKKAGKKEKHHRTPKYLGGDPKGPTVPLDGSYHQEITNEFRRLWPYGQAKKPTASKLKQILKAVYDKFPI